MGKTFASPPESVRRGILLLWAGLLITLLETVATLAPMDAADDGFTRSMAVLLVFMFGLNAACIHYASRRSNWARILLALYYISGLVLLAVYWRDMEVDPWWEWISTVCAYLLELTGLVLLFTGAGAKWYRERALTAHA